MREKILIIHERSEIRENLSQILSSKYQVLLAKDENLGLSTARREKPAVTILSGTDITSCDRFRRNAETRCSRVLASGAFSSVTERVTAFAAGADGLLIEPSTPEEIMALVESQIRRYQEESRHLINGTNALEFGHLKINFTDLKVTIQDSPMELGSVEFKILSLLARNHGQLVEREKLNQFVWGEEVPSERALDPHINALRKKLSGSNVDLKTIYGVGYSFVTHTA